MLRSFLWGSISTLSLAVLGCSAESTPPADAENHHSNEHTNHEETEMDDAFAKLSPQDREAALAQKICPVSNQPLGSMGTPIKVSVEGRDVFVCCQGCVDELKSKFDEYAKQLDD